MLSPNSFDRQVLEVAGALSFKGEPICAFSFHKREGEEAVICTSGSKEMLLRRLQYVIEALQGSDSECESN